MAIYSFNRSLQVNDGEITWPGGSISINNNTDLENRGVKRKESSVNIYASKKKRVEKEHSYDKIMNYKQMLEMMQPGETVAKTLRRLEGGKGESESGRQRLKVKTVRKSTADPIKMKKMLKLVTETGIRETYDLYEETYESIRGQIQCQLQADAGDDAAQVHGWDLREFERRQEGESGQSEAQDETPSPGPGQPLHVHYQNTSIDEIFSLESHSSGSDWSPANAIQTETEERESRMETLRPTANIRLFGAGIICETSSRSSRGQDKDKNK